MGRSVILLVFALCPLGITSAVADKNVCSRDNILACEQTRNVLWDASIASELRRLIGERRAGWLYDGLMADQVIDVLNGPDPNPPVRFAGNLIRFSACRWHSCDEKGAVVLTTDGEIVAVGVLHYDISRTRSGHPMLTILTRKQDDRFQVAADHLIAWYKWVVTSYNNRMKERYGLSDTSEKLRKISAPEIVVLSEPADSKP